jgi:hypothetical protein
MFKDKIDEKVDINYLNNELKKKMGLIDGYTEITNLSERIVSSLFETD